MNKDEILALATRVEACVEDAKRPMALGKSSPFDPFGMVEEPPDPRIASLANGLKAVAAALRAMASEHQPRETDRDNVG